MKKIGKQMPADFVDFVLYLFLDNRGVRMVMGADKFGFLHRGMIIPRYVFHDDLHRSAFRQIRNGRLLQIGKAYVFQCQSPPTGTAL